MRQIAFWAVRLQAHRAFLADPKFTVPAVYHVRRRCSEPQYILRSRSASFKQADGLLNQCQCVRTLYSLHRLNEGENNSTEHLSRQGLPVCSLKRPKSTIDGIKQACTSRETLIEHSLAES